MDISAGIVLFNPDIKRLKENIDAVIVQCTHAVSYTHLTLPTIA